MNSIKKFLLILLLFSSQHFFSEDIIKINENSEIGYNREFWGRVEVKVSIKCMDGRIKSCIEISEDGKLKIKKNPKIHFKRYSKLWEYIISNKILYLKSAIINESLTDDELFELYGKKFPRKYSYWYHFFFKIGDTNYNFGVEDMGYIKDARYRKILEKINELLKIKTEINVFGENSVQ